MKPLFLIIITFLISPFIMAQNKKPTAIKIPKELVALKQKRIDNYYWMNQRDSTDVLDYIDQENKYCESYFEPLNPLVEELMAEFDRKIDPNEEGAPFYFNKKLYQVKNEKGLEYQKTFLKEGEKEILF
ncbi:hypothetical protein OAK67_02500, partial [Crocinitomicaceae bacterium]|nr:hypothetical protein [Crocinitomicaceae bacterium]